MPRRRVAKTCNFIFACGLFATSLRAAITDTTSQYPELPAARNYVHVAKISVDAWNKKFKLPPPQKSAVLDYVFHRMPVSEFEQLMLNDDLVLKKGHKDSSLQKTEQYRLNYDACDYVSGHMAMLVVRNALNVYERKILKPDPLTRALFAANPGREDEVCISGIEERTSVAEFKRNTNSKFPLQAGDSIYLYGTSYGKGYLIVRNNKIVKNENWLEY